MSICCNLLSIARGEPASSALQSNHEAVYEWLLHWSVGYNNRFLWLTNLLRCVSMSRPFVNNTPKSHTMNDGMIHAPVRFIGEVSIYINLYFVAHHKMSVLSWFSLRRLDTIHSSISRMQRLNRSWRIELFSHCLLSCSWVSLAQKCDIKLWRRAIPSLMKAVFDADRLQLFMTMTTSWPIQTLSCCHLKDVSTATDICSGWAKNHDVSSRQQQWRSFHHHELKNCGCVYISCCFHPARFIFNKVFEFRFPRILLFGRLKHINSELAKWL